MVEYLFSLDHRKIGFVGGREYINKNKEPLEDERETTFMGITAVDLLLERINENRSIPKKVIIPFELALRESCKQKL